MVTARIKVEQGLHSKEKERRQSKKKERKKEREKEREIGMIEPTYEG